MHILPPLLQPEHLIPAFGLIGVFCTLVVEAGFLFGVFLPGDSLLFTAGIFASTGVFHIGIVYLVCFFGTFIGDQVGYSIGRKFGPKIFKSEKSGFFNKSHLEKTEQYFATYGPRTIIIARFVPFVRTGVPTFAGAGKMPYKTFLKYNTIGAVIWTFVFVTFGYLAGKVFKGHLDILTFITSAIVVISVLVVLVEVLKHRRRNKKSIG